MLLIQIEKHNSCVYNLGARFPRSIVRDGTEDDPLKWVRLRYSNLNMNDARKLMEADKQKGFEDHSFEFAGHKLLSALEFEKKFLELPDNEIPLSRLIVEHHRMIEKEGFAPTFDAYLRMAYSLQGEKVPKKGACGLFYTYDGKIVFIVMNGYVPEVTVIDEDSILDERIVNTVRQLIDHEVEAMTKRAEEAGKLHAKIVTKGTFRNFDIVKQIRDAGVLKHFNRR